MDLAQNQRKAFVYVTRRQPGGHELLAFCSHEEPGFEVPKGALEPGETFEDAARRELSEEAGLTAGDLTKLGTTWYEGEEQHFFHLQAPLGVPARFRHAVTGGGGDAGLVYEFEFLPIDDRLASRLVQGSGAFVAALASRLCPPRDGAERCC